MQMMKGTAKSAGIHRGLSNLLRRIQAPKSEGSFGELARVLNLELT